MRVLPQHLLKSVRSSSNVIRSIVCCVSASAGVTQSVRNKHISLNAVLVSIATQFTTVGFCLDLLMHQFEDFVGGCIGILQSPGFNEGIELLHV